MRISAIGISALAAVTMLTLTSCAGGSDEAEGDVEAVKITVTTDASGPTVATQVPFREGVEAFFENYNANLSEGQHEIEVQYVDDKYDAAQGVASYRTAISNGSVALIGPAGSGQLAALADSESRSRLSPPSPRRFSTTRTCGISHLHS